MEVTIREEVDPAQWDAQVAKNPSSTIYQTTVWARYMAKVAAGKALYLEVRDGDCVIATLMLTRKPYLSEEFGNRQLGIVPKAWSAAGYNTFFWMQGPIFYQDDECKNAQALALLLEKVRQMGKPQRAKKLLPSSSLAGLPAEGIEAMKKHGFEVKEWCTSIVPIASEEEMQSRIKHEARKNINKLQADERIKVHRISAWDEHMEGYLRILRETRKRLGERMPPHYPSRDFFERLEGHGGVVLVEKDGEAIGGMGVIFYNKTVVEVATAIGERALREKDYVGDLIKWEIMRWAAERGMAQYDLMGFSPNPANPKEEGIARFKRKFGGSDRTYYYINGGLG